MWGPFCANCTPPQIYTFFFSFWGFVETPHQRFLRTREGKQIRKSTENDQPNELKINQCERNHGRTSEYQYNDESKKNSKIIDRTNNSIENGKGERRTGKEGK